eukprot:m.56846 g.56846  ORF g.56846 m.56846 type:complete len:299 (-) comp11203_c3_seq1:752-1648(-)
MYLDKGKMGLFRDEYDASFHKCQTYRGQNANMHLCEAFISAYEATGRVDLLHRAVNIAEAVTGTLASLNDNNLVWEHYTENWMIDWDYHRDNPKHVFKPWGFQVGHQIEWAKLLLTIRRILLSEKADLGNMFTTVDQWEQKCTTFKTRAQRLFSEACRVGWDYTNGGFFYGFAPDESICDDDKYFWVQAEGIATAALLAESVSSTLGDHHQENDDETPAISSQRVKEETTEEGYWMWYERIWEYSWKHMIDHKHGGWYRLLTFDNKPYSNKKSPAGKVDYHTIGACCEVIQCLKRCSS